MNKGQHRTDREFLEKLEECFEDAFSDERELDRLLVSQGYNPKEDVDQGLALVKKLLWERKMAKARGKIEIVAKLIHGRVAQHSEVGPEKVVSLLKNAFAESKGQPSLQTFFRHCQGLDDEGRRAILEDKDLLEQIEAALKEDNESQ